MPPAAHLGLGLELLSGDSVVLRDAVHLVGGGLRRQVPATLFGHDVDEHGAHGLGRLDLCEKHEVHGQGTMWCIQSNSGPTQILFGVMK